MLELKFVVVRFVGHDGSELFCYFDIRFFPEEPVGLCTFSLMGTANTMVRSRILPIALFPHLERGNRR